MNIASKGPRRSPARLGIRLLAACTAAATAAACSANDPGTSQDRNRQESAGEAEQALPRGLDNGTLGNIPIPPINLFPRGQTLTQHNDQYRRGANRDETTLTPANVTPSTFGRLYTRAVDGQIIAQPLYAKGITFKVGAANVAKNVVYVATEHNTVYAFDADDASTSPTAGVLAARSFEAPQYGEMCNETYGPVGITSTPVIDWWSNVMYVVTRAYHAYYLHKIDLATLADVTPAVPISASVPNGTGTLTFDAAVQRQRPGLLLVNGVVYLGFGTYSCDAGPYHGWVLGYDTNLHQVGAYVSSRSDAGAGIWMSGSGLAADAAGDIFFTTGNGPIDEATGDLGQAFVKLHPQPGRANSLDSSGAVPQHQLADNYAALNAGDVDLGSGGVTILPGNRVVGGGKDGRLYEMDTATMNRLDLFQAFYNEWHSDWAGRDTSLSIATAGQYGKCGVYNSCYITVDQYQRWEIAGPNIHGSLVYLPGVTSDYGLLFGMPEKEYLKSYRYHPSTGVIDHGTMWNTVSNRTETTPNAASAAITPNGMPGAALTISANGNTNAIVWASYPKVDTMWTVMPGRLAAFDAVTLHQLWSDEDDVAFAKFNPPTVGDGKVFRPTFGRELIVYGLKSPANDSQDPCYTIDQKFANFGAEDGNLIAAVSALPYTVTSDGVGRFVDYKNGNSIYWTPSRCAHVVGGAIRDKWSSLGREHFNGYPHTDETATPDQFGRFNHFDYGSIYWSPATDAHEVHGAIRDRWASLGWERFNGYPTTDESPTPDGVGRFNDFQYGSIYWHPSTGAWEVHGAIRDKWTSLGRTTNANLGYPVTNETGTPDGVGRFNRFQNGSIYWTAALGAHETHGPIRDKWVSLGAEQSADLGYPTSDVQPYTRFLFENGFIQYFERGYVYWLPSTGAVVGH